MKALTVQQPWAWAIIHGGKDVENRTQAWTYRGPLAIHAGARWSDRGATSPLIIGAAIQGFIEDGLVHSSRRDEHAQLTLELGGVRPNPAFMGAIVGVVDLVDVHLPDQSVPCCTSPWAEMQAGVHLVLEHPRELAEPIPCRGALGLWTPPGEVLEQLEEAMRA